MLPSPVLSQFTFKSAQLDVYLHPKSTTLNHKAEKYYPKRLCATAKHNEARSNQATLNSTENAIFLQSKKIHF
jgi:hypothetical protein